LIACGSFRLLTREPSRIDAGTRLIREAFGSAADAVKADEIGLDPNPKHLPASTCRASA